MQRITREEGWRAKEARLRELLRGGLAGNACDYQAFLMELSAHLRAFLRRRAAQDLLTDPLDDEMYIFSSADSEAAEARRDLNTLLDGLPDRQRLPIVHTRLEGLSVKEAARLTGLSESAIKVGVHRGLKALAAMIRGDR